MKKVHQGIGRGRWIDREGGKLLVFLRIVGVMQGEELRQFSDVAQKSGSEEKRSDHVA
jgi:hypothetical protein